MAEVVIRVRGMEKPVEGGRVRVVLGDGTERSLDVSRIKELYFLNGEFYIRYETDNADFYRPYAVSEIPRLAIKLRHSVKEEKVFVCGVCGAELEWDVDDLVCPNYCEERYENWSYRVLSKKYLVVEPDGDEIIQFAGKLFGVKITEKAAELCRTAAGGFAPLFGLVEVEVPLLNVTVWGVAVVENPAFRETDYDDISVNERRFAGRLIAVKYWDRSVATCTALYEFQGEPDASLLAQLHEDWRQKEERRKEEQRRALEEMERRWREEEQRWGDPRRVIDAVLRALPQWADGAVVVARTVDDDTVYEVYPVKKSQRGAGYYYSREWRTLKTGVPQRFLERLADTVILRNGTIVEVKNKRQNGSGKYVTLET